MDKHAKPDEKPNPAHIQNNLQKLTYVDPTKATHYIVGYRCYSDKTVFRIRTSVKNTTIVEDILTGRLPAFSIRTHGLFLPDPAFGGCYKATNLVFVTIDYVRNQADVKAIADLEVTKVDVVSGEKVKLEIDSRIGTESDIIINNFYKNNEILVNPKNNDVQSAIEHGVMMSVKATKEEMLKEVYSGIF